ncbi:ABC transporter substrate-binding protein [Streptomyces sp. NPDC051218]|uniref:ABC transporter substrate-binding protein n=1 Tax=Streptomyces sp. NPDC051218 TaxID=3365645 RepID=UPI00378CC6F8
MDGSMSRRFAVCGLTGLLSLGLAACSGSDSSGVGKDGVVTISVNGMPPKTQALDRKWFEQDVKAFEKSHPKINIEAHEGQMNPQTFSAKLAGGQLEDVYYVYFTDPAVLIARGQAADITPHLEGVPYVKDVKPEFRKIFTGPDRKVYGLPNGQYSLGLVYNRALFKKAGLDPDKPPATWGEVRAAAKKITALGDGTVGYADYSKNNQGGWHLTSWIYSMGGDVAVKDGNKWTSAVDGPAARKALTMLHDMRFTDDSMGSRQLLEIADAQKMMGAGKLGMYMAGPDNLPTIVKQFDQKYADFGVAPMPGGKATLGGGNGFMFNPKASPQKIKAGIQWVQWKYLNPDRKAFESKRASHSDVPIGLPLDHLFGGAAADTWDAAEKKYANVPQGNYTSFVKGNDQLEQKVEPPNAQQIYAELDKVMQAVLTKKNANIDSLLATADKKINTILAAAK